MRNEDHKIVGFEDSSVSKLLRGLKRVEAPGDFDFRVKARIATGRPANRTASWVPNSVKLALSMALLLVIGGYFGFDALYSGGKAGVSPVAEVQSSGMLPITSVEPSAPAAVNKPLEVATTYVTPSRVGIKPSGKNETSAVVPNEKRILSVQPSLGQPGGGSYDEASRKPKQIFPKGIDPNGRPVTSNGSEANTAASGKDIFTTSGISASHAGSSWAVTGVKSNSSAERSGLKAGDVIESVNGKSLHVRRDGKSMQIELKP